ncbi:MULTISPECIES: 6,7-dimethyl-8-ribityllumazine synthase [Petrimonas]|jgi:6,7-dimethyl-8-ribityllumazine synthase|uniref:6,7-dimethyl-8-ribityllumazine synthase n=1 Tax=Petrimonas mucosa TaxID=1642646 RepID=A0A1G4G5K0_9BACT|nr:MULTISPECIES: 6,7-dimethyl-8-ribityllumazine synthase [Petrimonas]MDD3560928.1 6,7-dimethyl-8-ribityllumazine synthase [Petrimonas mucosa]SCM56567.1 6,7-dimethyl-8-ribityllumazine synthase {ECO:0000255/HAMAP-Rule:MF_00178} [Petrimonas mucosa]SFU57266.1 6,7-dimethyl-8-ribityllumazine synthase [Porphyromonadaceae bacterium KHP3R9]HHT29920.1 6,7-dimethyl-8-ribityllumazine synthase [Petrimonas mucosa]
MATELHNLSSYDHGSVPSGEGKRIGIVVSEWNRPVTGNLLEGTVQTLLKFGVNEKDIVVEYVPGSFELTFGAKKLIEKADIDGVIVIGCVIQGETPHFTFVCDSVTQGVTELNIRYNIPVIFGLLTTNTLEQAKARSGGRHGNKGDEAAITLLKMVALNEKYK